MDILGRRTQLEVLLSVLLLVALLALLACLLVLGLGVNSGETKSPPVFSFHPSLLFPFLTPIFLPSLFLPSLTLRSFSHSFKSSLLLSSVHPPFLPSLTHPLHCSLLLPYLTPPFSTLTPSSFPHYYVLLNLLLLSHLLLCIPHFKFPSLIPPSLSTSYFLPFQLL